MRRAILPLLLALLASSIAGPVLAAKPARGCPNPAFMLMSPEAFRALSLSVGVPPELLGADWEAGLLGFDKNGDRLICVKDLPDTRGHAGGWVFNVVDNTSHPRPGIDSTDGSIPGAPPLRARAVLPAGVRVLRFRDGWWARR
jgi:hypothetical protein